MQRTMNRGTVSCSTGEKQGDRVNFTYNGKDFNIPRWDYERRLTQQDFDRSAQVRADEQIRLISNTNGKRVSSDYRRGGTQVEASEKQRFQASTSGQSVTTENPHFRNNLDQHLKFLEELEGNFRQSMSQPSSSSEWKSSSKKAEGNEEPNMEQIFTLEDITESKETVIEQPITKKTSHQSATEVELPKSSSAHGASSAESLEARKSMEVTEKLFQLKSKVVNLIDQTINQIELDQDFTGEGTSKAIPLHPSGDGSTLDYRTQNLQVLKTDSFARSRKDIRTKLYREIKIVLKRLEDLESLG